MTRRFPEVEVDPELGRTALALATLVAAGDVDAAVQLTNDPVAVIAVLIAYQSSFGLAAANGLDLDPDVIVAALSRSALEHAGQL